MSIQGYADEINAVLEHIRLPDANCRCFQRAPCNDCVSYGFAREAIKILNDAINKEPYTMSTNSSLTYALLLPDAISIAVEYIDRANGQQYENGNRSGEYTYKALLGQNLAIGDVVVVPIKSHGELQMKLARVIRVDEFLDVNTTRDYHWVVQKVDTAQFDELREKEKVVAKHLQLRERADARDRLLKQLFENSEQENALRRELGLEVVQDVNTIMQQQQV